MAQDQIPMDEVQELWSSLPEKNWTSLMTELENRKGKTEGMSDSLINEMIGMARDMENSGEPFPTNPDELFNMLNSQ